MNFKKSLIAIFVVFILSAPLGSLVAQDPHKGHKHYSKQSEMKSKQQEASFWTCSMHPQIKLKEPGKCPICGMNLIPVNRDETDESSSNGAATLKLSKTAQKLADIQHTKVKRKSLKKELRLVGTIDYDETRLTHITAWVPGRIERMFVDYTGVSVKKGDHMLELYSPELISAQEELIQANRSLKRLKNSSSALVKKSTERAAKSVEEKLLLLGLTGGQVQKIKEQAKPEDNVVIYAPTGGVVVERSATEGMYVKEGTRIYSIAGLDNLWIYLDAYESDLPWIRYGQKVSFSVKALPGTEFEGTVSFISPVVDPETRTTKVRVSVDNSKGQLKPGLFVKGVIKAEVYGKGKVISAELKGKYISPMHPEVVRDEPGDCPVCGMDLVPAEELGYVTEEETSELPLVIPASAPLITGKRAIVYVKHPKKSVFESRNVVLGPEAEGYYVVVSGLKEGERVVSNGAFKIDADLQIRGKTSMMNPKGGKAPSGHQH